MCNTKLFLEGLANKVVFEDIPLSKCMHDIFLSRDNKVLSKLIIKSVRVHKHIEARV